VRHVDEASAHTGLDVAESLGNFVWSIVDHQDLTELLDR